MIALRLLIQFCARVCRFWSSSLLLIYEGDQAPTSLTREGFPRIDLKIIDFAHSVHNQECTDDQSGVDQGMVRGLISLIECLGNISLETCNSQKNLKTPGWRQGSCSGTPQSTQGSTSRARATNTPMPSRALGSLVNSHSQSDLNDFSTLIGPMGTSFGTLSGSNESLSLAGSPFASFGAPFGTSMLQNDAVNQAATQAATDLIGMSSLGSINGCPGEELESFSISDVT